jgi:hypothetical protein
MKRIAGGCTVLALSLTLGAAPAAAQVMIKPWTLGFGGGATVPQSDFAEIQKVGWHVVGLVDFNFPTVPVGVRVDGGYHALAGKDVTDDDPFPEVQVINVNGNLTYTIPGFVTVRPYAVGGVGYYSSKSDVTNAERVNRLGFNGGVGFNLNLVGFAAFIEGRFHYITKDGNVEGATAVQFIPITLGLRF